MDQNERQIIDELFGKLRQAEAQSGLRDPQAENYIREQVTRQPAAPSESSASKLRPRRDARRGPSLSRADVSRPCV